MVTVAELWIYPIKSLRGIALDASRVGGRGLEHDRRWMLVDETGKFMTIRSDRRLARFSTHVGDKLTVRHEGAPDCEIPLSTEGKGEPVSVWGDVVEAVEASLKASAWFSDILSMDCRLVYMPEATRRPLGDQDPSECVSFADSSPVLVATESSLAAINAMLATPVTMNRFRANVVLRGAEAWDEESWSGITVNNHAYRMRKRCGRCIVTTLDPITGESLGDEPLRTLSRERLFGKSACFGTYYVPLGTGSIRVGDVVFPQP